jgi:hypothetical protein
MKYITKIDEDYFILKQHNVNEVVYTTIIATTEDLEEAIKLAEDGMVGGAGSVPTTTTAGVSMPDGLSKKGKKWSYTSFKSYMTRRNAPKA